VREDNSDANQLTSLVSGLLVPCLKLFVPYELVQTKLLLNLSFSHFRTRWHSEDSSRVCHVMLVPGKTYMLACHEIFVPSDYDVILSY